MGSPLGALFADIFMKELEENIIPKLKDLKGWIRYVDDTFAFVKPDKIEAIQGALNSLHEKINFTYESEKDQKLPFLDVLVMRKDNREMETKVYRKETNTDIYMNWNSHAPQAWKISTLRCLVKRAVLLCSEERYLQEELEHLKKVFSEYNQYPMNVIRKVIENGHR